jgi:hypothetical protein
MGELARKAKAMLLSGVESNQGLRVEETAIPRDMVEAPELIRVSYQRIFYDWDLADGTYTPEQLRKARVVVRPWGPLRQYTLKPWALRQPTAQMPQKEETV